MKLTKRQIRRIIKESITMDHVAYSTEPEKNIYGHGGSAKRAKSQLYQIVKDATELHDILNDEDELPEWVQSKIAVIEDNIDEILDHLEYKYRSNLGGEEIGFIEEPIINIEEF